MIDLKVVRMMLNEIKVGVIYNQVLRKLCMD